MVKAKLRKKYSGPAHIWQMVRLKEEAQLRKDYGYKNKKEIWKMFSILRNFRAQARRLIPKTGEQADLEKKQLINRLVSLGLVTENAQIEDVLALDIRKLLDRRLQTLLLRKRMANSVKQARQFITHGHIVIGAQKIKTPSHLVTIQEEPLISFAGNSSLMSDMHPERVLAKQEKGTVKGEKKIINEDVEEKKEEEEIKKLEVI